MRDVEYYLNFQHRDPYANFNRNLVKGKVGRLFKVKDIEKDAVALFAVAGGRLANVVVDN
jgi:chromosome segregation ATPase